MIPEKNKEPPNVGEWAKVEEEARKNCWTKLSDFPRDVLEPVEKKIANSDGQLIFVRNRVYCYVPSINLYTIETRNIVGLIRRDTCFPSWEEIG